MTLKTRSPSDVCVDRFSMGFVIGMVPMVPLPDSRRGAPGLNGIIAKSNFRSRLSDSSRGPPNEKRDYLSVAWSKSNAGRVFCRGWVGTEAINFSAKSTEHRPLGTKSVSESFRPV